MLEEMEEDFSGFFQGVKEILKARGSKLQGIEGAVAELIQVPKEYETAIETALGGAMQHIIVQNEQDGRSAIQFLKKNSYGRATFLPLSVVKGKRLNTGQLQSVQGHPAFIGEAATLIRFEGRHQSAIENLLGNVVIARDLKGANELAKLLQYRVRLVTIDGDVVNPGGSMTGGALKQKSTSILSRKGELEELKSRILDMESKTANLEKQVKLQKSEIQKQETRIEQLRKTGEELRLMEQRVKGELLEVEFEEKSINERLSLYDMDKAQFSEDRERLLTRKSELADLLEQQQKQIADLDNEIKALTERKTPSRLQRKLLYLK